MNIIKLYLQALLQAEGFVALWARVGLVIGVVADVVEPRRVAIVSPAAEDAGVDLGAVPRLGVIEAGANVVHQLGSRRKWSVPEN